MDDPTPLRSDVDRKKFDELLHARRLSMRKLAPLMGVDSPTLTRLLKGQRIWRLDYVILAARALNVTLPEMLKVLGYPSDTKFYAVSGALTEYGIIEEKSQKIGLKIPSPVFRPGICDVVSVEVGETSEVSYLDGSYIFLGATVAPDINHVGTLGVVSAAGHPAPILGAIKGGHKKSLMITNFITRQDMTTRRVVSFAPVEAWTF